MRFKSIRLTGRTTINIAMVGATPLDKYVVKSIDGLGPSEVDTNLSKVLYQGAVLQSAQPQTRQIVIKVKLNPNYAGGERPDTLRTDLYGILAANSRASMALSLMDGATTKALTQGVVKNVEPALNDKDNSIQITIDCLSAYLRDSFSTSLNAASLASSPLINYPGSAPAGFSADVTIGAAASAWSLSDAEGNGVRVTYPLQVGDRIIFNTTPGLRSINHRRASTTTNLLGSLQTSHKWIMLYPGNNQLNSVSTNTWGAFSFLTQYLGV